MKTIPFILLAAGLVFGAANKGSTVDLLTSLRDDTKHAAAVPEIKDKDRKTIDKAIQKLDKNIDAAAQGKEVNHGDIRKSLDDIGKVAKTFNEADRKTVYDDMAAIRDKKLDKDKAQKKNPSSKQSNPFPNNRNPNSRNPRF